MNSVRFHDDARLELIEQVAHYEAARKGLGEAFNAAVEAAVGTAARNPDSGLQYNFMSAPPVGDYWDTADSLPRVVSGWFLVVGR